ncbi:MAG TPA: hypothetical protein VF625_14270 [Longimicrobium sp.]|jgi:uncharacterized protein YbaR (Trm112 family)
MYILLTDLLTCPRCGPEFGLIVLSDRMENRRVVAGRLGCANCREMYPVENGVADLRLAAGEPDGAPSSDPDAPLRLAALMGLAEVRGTVLLAGPGAELAPEVAALVEGVEVVAFAGTVPDGPIAEGVSRVVGGPRLPFRAGMMRAAALTGGAALLDEAVRVLAPGARIVVEPAEAGTADRLRALGAEVLLEQDATVVARVAGAAQQPRLHQLR